MSKAQSALGGKLLIGLMIIAFIALVTWVLTTVPEAPTNTEPQEEKRIMSYEGNTLTSEKNGKRQWILTAEKMSVDVDTQDAYMEGIKVIFYGEDGKELHLTAPKGVYYHKDKNFGVYDGTKATMSDGAELTSDKLYWLAKDEMLVAEKDVKVKKDDLFASGDRMESKNAFTSFKIIGHAHVAKSAENKNKEGSKQ